jgi:hypothetical protein
MQLVGRIATNWMYHIYIRDGRRHADIAP